MEMPTVPMIRHNAKKMKINPPDNQIYVTPVKHFARSQLRGYFSRYGIVKSLQIYSHGHFHSALIRFKSAKSAKAALLAKTHRIGGQSVLVKRAKKRLQPSNNRPIQPSLTDQSHRQDITVLNDKCLREIFTHLHLRDLCNVADVCKRFRENAKEVFVSTYSKLDILELIQGDDDYHDGWFKVRWLSERFMESVERLFQIFGSNIEALSLTGNGSEHGLDDNQLLTLVKTYCSALKELVIRDIGEEEFSIELKSMFAGLEKLSVFYHGYYTSDSFIALFSDCHELKHLKIFGHPSGMWMNHKFPKLETLDVSRGYDTDFDKFEAFLMSHENLRTLKYDYWGIPSEKLVLISKSLTKLETLCLIASILDLDDEDEDEDTVNKNILELSKLKSLKNFTFECKTSSMKLLVDAFHKENTPIEYFEMIDCKVDNELVFGLPQLKSMKTLKLTQCEMVEDTLISLAKNMNQLETLIIEDVKGLNSDDIKGKLSFAKYVRILNSSKKPERMPVDQDSSEILEILDDDCLQEVFKHLPIPDLCNVADVCQRFQQNAQDVFKATHKSSEQFCETRFNIDEIRRCWPDPFDMQAAEKVFRNFGPMINELILMGDRLSTNEKESILYLVNKYCKSVLVLFLVQFGIEGPFRWIALNKPLLDFLVKLCLHNCPIHNDFSKFLSTCTIINITIRSYWRSRQYLNHTFPDLITFTLAESAWYNEDLIEFLKLNQQLLTLIIINSDFTSRLFKSIADELPTLQSFYLIGDVINQRGVTEDMLHLAKLKTLRVLALNFRSASVKRLIEELVKEKTPLELLSIKKGTIDKEILVKMSEIKSIKSLELSHVKMDRVSLKDLAEHLPMLQILCIELSKIQPSDIVAMLPSASNLRDLTIGAVAASFLLDVVDYRSMLNIVNCRTNGTKLCVKIISEAPQVLVPKSMLQLGHHCLRIVNEVRDQNAEQDSDTDTDPDSEDPPSESDVEEDEDIESDD